MNESPVQPALPPIDVRKALYAATAATVVDRRGEGWRLLASRRAISAAIWTLADSLRKFKTDDTPTSEREALTCAARHGG